MTVSYEIILEGQLHTVTVSDEPEALLAAQAAGRAVLGVGEECAKDCPQVSVFLADWDCARPETVERAARRKAGLPWILCGSARLTVREGMAEDWDALAAGMGGGSGEGLLIPALASREAFEAYAAVQYRFYEYGLWVVEEKKTGLPVGMAGVWNPGEETCRRLRCGGEDPELYLEMGYEIFPPFRRQGFALEACRAVMAYADWELECRLCVRIAPENTPSLRLAERLGFWPLPEPPATRTDSGETRPPCLFVWSC